MADKLRYQLKTRGVGDYVRVPLGDGLTMFASDAEIGAPIDRGTLQQVMLDSRSEWGSITTSKGWRAEPDPPNPEKKIIDLGICTNRIDYIRTQIAHEYSKIPTTEREYSSEYHIFHREEVGARIDEIAGLTSDSEFWQIIKAAGYGRGRDEISEFVDRLIAR